MEYQQAIDALRKGRLQQLTGELDMIREAFPDIYADAETVAVEDRYFPWEHSAFECGEVDPEVQAILDRYGAMRLRLNGNRPHPSRLAPEADLFYEVLCLLYCQWLLKADPESQIIYATYR